MGNFFDNVFTNKEDQKWCEVLNWLLSEERFKAEIWKQNNGSLKTEFTNRLKQMEPINKNFHKYKSKDFQQHIPQKPKSKRSIYVIFTSAYVNKKKLGGGESLLKHIRNGIAHGNVDIIGNKNQEQYIEIKDYKADGEQTAYIYFPLNCIVEIYDLYKELENNGKPPKGKQKSNKSKGKKPLTN